METKAEEKYYCYVLRPSKHKQKSACGNTNDLEKQLDTLNKIKKSGGKKPLIWEYYIIIEGFVSKEEAESFEYLLKHPTRTKKRPKEYTGVSGRVKSLNLILTYDKWLDDKPDGLEKAIKEGREYNVYIDSKYFGSIDKTKIKSNIHVKDIKEFEKSYEYIVLKECDNGIKVSIIEDNFVKLNIPKLKIELGMEEEKK